METTRTFHKGNKKLNRYVKQHGIDDTALAMFDKILAKKTNKKSPARPIASMMDEDRTFYTDKKYYTSWVEAGFIPYDCTDWTGADIQEYVDDMKLYINSPYDCTGKAFTKRISWHRNPNGLVSYVHSIGIDC